MKCAYVECAAANVPKLAAICPECSRNLRVCPACELPNRPFSAYCRACGEAVTEPQDDWSGFRSGPSARALNPFKLSIPNEAKLTEVAEIELGDTCKSLLSYHGYLIAIARNGVISVVDPKRRDEIKRWTMEGEVFGEACVSRGILYVGGDRMLAAYTLGRALAEGVPTPRWSVPVDGIPIFSLLAIEGHLYAVLGMRDRSKRVVTVDDRARGRSPQVELIFDGPKVSSLAGHGERFASVYFLSEASGSLTLNRVDPLEAPRAVTAEALEGAPLPLVDHVPIATVGHKLFCVLGESHDLCRIEADRAAFGRQVEADVRAFALNGIRDGAVLQTDGIKFLGSNTKEALQPNERTSGAPIVLRDRLVVLGFRDGRIRWYHLSNTPAFEEVRLAGEDEVKALVSFQDLVAAGSRSGKVKIYQVLEGGSV